MCFSIYGTDDLHEMHCTGLKMKFLVCAMPHPLLLIRPHLSLDSLQKVGLLARLVGGAVEKNGQPFSPVTVLLMKCILPNISH